MLRRSGSFKPTPNVVNCILLNGGLGDHVGTLVAVDYIIRTYTWITLLVWVPDFLLEFAKNVLPKTAIVRDFSSMKKKYDKNKTTITTEWDGRTSPMKMHTVDYALLKLCDEVLPPEKKNYLRVNFDEIDISTLKLPEKYLVITTGFTAPVREFHPEAVNGVSSYALSKGITPVFVGKQKTATGGHHSIRGTFKNEIDYQKGIMLVDQTSLLQVAKVIQGAQAIVGVDCGLLHVAGCTDVPIIGGFTTVDPKHRAPIRRNQLGWNFYPVTPPALLVCRFCQSNTNFLYGHDYRFCIYKDYQCVSELTAERFIRQLEPLLSVNSPEGKT